MQALNSAKDKVKNAAENTAAKGASATMGAANKASGGAAGKLVDKGKLAEKLATKGAMKGLQAGVSAAEYVPDEAKNGVKRVLIGTFTSAFGCLNCCMLFLIFCTGILPFPALVKVFPLGVLTVEGDYTYNFKGTYADGTAYAYVGQAQGIKVVKNYGLLGNSEEAEGQYLLDGEELWGWFATTLNKGKTHHCAQVSQGGLAGLASAIFCTCYTASVTATDAITALGHPITRDDQRTLLALTINNPLNSLFWGDLPPEVEVTFELDANWPCNQDDWPPAGLIADVAVFPTGCPDPHDIGDLPAECTETNQICEKNRPSTAKLTHKYERYLTSFGEKSGHAGRTCNDFWFLAMFMSVLSLLLGLFGSIACWMRLWPAWDTAGKGGTQAIAASTLVLMGGFGWGILLFFEMTCGQNQFSESSAAAGIETWALLPIGKLAVLGLGSISILLGPKLHQMLPPGTTEKPATHKTQTMAPKFQG